MSTTACIVLALINVAPALLVAMQYWFPRKSKRRPRRRKTVQTAPDGT